MRNVVVCGAAGNRELSCQGAADTLLQSRVSCTEFLLANTRHFVHAHHQLGRLVSESAFEREDPGSNPAADMVDAARNTAWDLGKLPNNYRSNYPTQEWARRMCATEVKDLYLLFLYINEVLTHFSSVPFKDKRPYPWELVTESNLPPRNIFSPAILSLFLVTSED
ncbi:hypothetical protein FHG87_013977 [Trinorchestia longiramus]|nr:hypothetical protein FHG87_013977 [Trinorchestia longiramus]